MKRIITLIICVALIATCFSFVACNGNQESKSTTNNIQSVPTTYVTMDINPSIELIVDQNNRVVSVKANNEDAEIMLYAEDGIINADVTIATEKILDLAVEYGYLTEENDGVEISVVSDLEEVENKVKGEVVAKIKDKSAKVNFDIKVCEDSFAVQRKLKEYKEQYPNLTAGKLKLILASMAVNPELTFDEAYNMSTEELLKDYKAAEDKVKTYCNSAYKKAIKKYEMAYEKALKTGKRTAGIIKMTELLAKKAQKDYLQYGLLAASIAGDVTNYGQLIVAEFAVKSTLMMIETVEEFPVDQTVANAVANSLGVDVETLKDEDGNYTIAGLEKYISDLVKNASEEEKQQIIAKYDELMAILDEAETLAKENDQILKGELLNSLITTIEAIKTEIESYGITIPDFSSMTIDELKEFEKELEVTIENKYNELLEYFTEDELAQIKKAEEKAEAELAREKEKLEKGIAQAEKDVKSYLEAKKAERKQA